MSEKTLSRRSFLRIGTLASAGLLAACAPKTEPTPVPAQPAATKPPAAAAPAKEPTEIRFHVFSGRYGDWSTKRAEDFAKTQDDVRVVVEPIPGGEYATKMRSMFATQLIGDAFWYYNVGGGWLAAWAHLGISAPADDFIQRDSLDLTQWFDSAIKGVTWDGNVMGLPIHGHPGFPAFAYNKPMLDEAGIAYPDPSPNWSLDDLIEAAIKLTKRTGDTVDQYGWITLTGYHAYVVWARIFGTDIISEDGTKSLINTAEFKEAMQWIHDAKFEHKVEPLPDQMEKGATQMFVAQRNAMQQIDSTIGSTWHVEIKDFDWYAALLPAGPRGDRGALSTTHLGSLISVSEKKDAAWEFLKYMGSYESGVDKVLVGAGAPGARPDCYGDPKVLETAPEYADIAKAFEFAGPERVPANVRNAEYVSTLDNNLADLWLGSVSVDQALDKTHKAVQSVLDLEAE